MLFDIQYRGQISALTEFHPFTFYLARPTVSLCVDAVLRKSQSTCTILVLPSVSHFISEHLILIIVILVILLEAQFQSIFT